MRALAAALLLYACADDAGFEAMADSGPSRADGAADAADDHLDGAIRDDAGPDIWTPPGDVFLAPDAAADDRPAPDATSPDDARPTPPGLGATEPNPLPTDDGAAWVCAEGWAPLEALGTCAPPDEIPSDCGAWRPAEFGGCRAPEPEDCGDGPWLGDGSCLEPWGCHDGWAREDGEIGCRPAPLRVDCEPGTFAVPGGACSAPWPCPGGWVRLADGIGCRPPALDCGPDGWVVGGECVEVASRDCPADFLRGEHPPLSQYVSAGAAPGGDGSVDRPFQHLDDALTALRFVRGTIVVAPGEYPVSRRVSDGVSLVGACAEGVQLVGAVSVGADVGLSHLSIAGLLTVEAAGSVEVDHLGLSTVRIGEGAGFEGSAVRFAGGEGVTIDRADGARFGCDGCLIDGDGHPVLVSMGRGPVDTDRRFTLTRSLVRGGVLSRARGRDYTLNYDLRDVTIGPGALRLPVRGWLERVAVHGTLQGNGGGRDVFVTSSTFSLEGVQATRIAVRAPAALLDAQRLEHVDWPLPRGLSHPVSGRYVHAPQTNFSGRGSSALEDSVLRGVNLRPVSLTRVVVDEVVAGGIASNEASTFVRLQDVEAGTLSISGNDVSLDRVAVRGPASVTLALAHAGGRRGPWGPGLVRDVFAASGLTLAGRLDGGELVVERLQAEGRDGPALRLITTGPTRLEDAVLRGEQAIALDEASVGYPLHLLRIHGIGDDGAVLEPSVASLTVEDSVFVGSTRLATADRLELRRVRFEGASSEDPLLSAGRALLVTDSRLEGGPLFEALRDDGTPLLARLERVVVASEPGLPMISLGGPARLDARSVELSGGGLAIWPGAQARISRASVASRVEVRGGELTADESGLRERVAVVDRGRATLIDVRTAVVYAEDATVTLTRAHVLGGGHLDPFLWLGPRSNTTLTDVVLTEPDMGIVLDGATTRFTRVWIDRPVVAARIASASRVAGAVRVTEE